MAQLPNKMGGANGKAGGSKREKEGSKDGDIFIKKKQHLIFEVHFQILL